VKKQYQILAEFAIGFPLLLFLFFGVMQLMFIYLDHIVVKKAAYDAARAYVSTMDSDVNTLATFDPKIDDVKGPSSISDRAHLAAALTCTPMTFKGLPDSTASLPVWFTLKSGQKIYWPGWSNNASTGLKNLEDSWYCTNVRVMNNNQPSNPNAKVVEVEVDHDLKLIFPIVGFMIANANKLFGSDYASINKDLAPEYQKNYSTANYHRVTEKCVIPINKFSESLYEK
jgi:hypothetical protein